MRPPSFDPRALLVTDRLAKADLLPKVDALGRAAVCDPRSVDDLRMAARAEAKANLRMRPRPTSSQTPASSRFLAQRDPLFFVE